MKLANENTTQLVQYLTDQRDKESTARQEATQGAGCRSIPGLWETHTTRRLASTGATREDCLLTLTHTSALPPLLCSPLQYLPALS